MKSVRVLMASIAGPFSAAGVGMVDRPATRWRTAARVTILSCLLLVGLFQDTVASMVAAYRTSSYEHGFAVVPIAAYLVWSRRQRAKSQMPVANPWGLPLLALLGFVWLLGNLADVTVVQQVAFVGMVGALVWTVLGSRVTLALRFPLTFLWFAVPVGVFVSPLQDFTARFTVKALELSGIPVLLEGRVLSVPFGRWEIAAACSGAHYLTASLMVGCLYVSATYRSWPRRIGFLLVSAIVPVLANAARAYGIIMLAYLSDNKIATGVDHVLYGWVFFSIVMVMLFAVGALWQEPLPLEGMLSEKTGPTSDGLCTEGSPSYQGGPRRSLQCPDQPPAEGFSTGKVNAASSMRGITLTAVAAVTLVALAPLWARLVGSRSATLPKAVRAAAPQVTPPWMAQDAYSGDWVPRFSGADATVLESYASGDRLVHLYLGYYVNERQGAELISSENDIADKKLWQPTAEGKARVTVDGRPLRVRTTVIRSRSGVTRLVWQWYWVGGAFTADPYEAKVRLAAARLFGKASASAVVVLASDCGFDCRAAGDTLQGFLRHSASLETLLRGFCKSDGQV